MEKLTDLRPGMVLEGVVTNVAAFGAFVDIGVHQDGLVHISAMSKTFIKDPREAAKPGDVVKVKVLEVDAARKRIALTMRLDDAFDAKAARGGAAASGGKAPPPRQGNWQDKPQTSTGGNAFAAAFAKASTQPPKKERLGEACGGCPVNAAGRRKTPAFRVCRIGVCDDRRGCHVGLGAGSALIRHFLDHYFRLGADRFLIILHTSPSQEGERAAALQIMESYGARPVMGGERLFLCSPPGADQPGPR